MNNPSLENGDMGSRDFSEELIKQADDRFIKRATEWARSAEDAVAGLIEGNKRRLAASIKEREEIPRRMEYIQGLLQKAEVENDEISSKILTRIIRILERRLEIIDGIIQKQQNAVDEDELEAAH